MDILQKRIINFDMNKENASPITHKTSLSKIFNPHNKTNINNKKSIKPKLTPRISNNNNEMNAIISKNTCNSNLLFHKPLHVIENDKKRFNFSVDKCIKCKNNPNNCSCNNNVNNSVSTNSNVSIILPSSGGVNINTEFNAPLSLFSDAKLYKFNNPNNNNINNSQTDVNSNITYPIISNSITAQTEAEYIQSRTQLQLKNKSLRIDNYFKQLQQRLNEKAKQEKLKQQQRINKLPPSVQALLYKVNINNTDNNSNEPTPLQLAILNIQQSQQLAIKSILASNSNNNEDDSSSISNESQEFMKYNGNNNDVEGKLSNSFNNVSMSKEEEKQYFNIIRKLELKRERELAYQARIKKEKQDKINQEKVKQSELSRLGFSTNTDTNNTDNQDSDSVSSNGIVHIEKVTDSENEAAQVLETRRKLNKRRILKKKTSNNSNSTQLTQMIKRQIMDKYKSLQQYIPPICNCKFDQQQYYLNTNNVNARIDDNTDDTVSIHNDSTANTITTNTFISYHSNNCIYYNNDSEYYRRLSLLIEQIQQEKTFFNQQQASSKSE